VSDARALERRPASDDRTVEALLASVLDAMSSSEMPIAVQSSPWSWGWS
jgi:hypothetical protein